MKAVAYLRVSTADQANKGLSLDTQAHKVIAYAKLYDIEISFILKEFYTAKSLQRPEFQKALNLLRERKVDGLLVTKLDRVSRNIGDWNYLVTNYFGQDGKHLWSVDDKIDTQSAAGRLVLNMLMSISQWEREIISERTREVLQYKRGKMERVGRIPYGYDLKGDGKSLVVNEVEQAGIRLIKGMREGRHSFRDIAEKLTEMGFATKSGHPWCHSSVAQINKRSMSLPLPGNI